ncbi:Gag polyprotein [Labeo rohita]|uniref:Gag polyprotein n=1 Tax=Labeo rohita TaxID=84645 RepID=A0ABQ8LKV6_LABRO|nr:Gag polyprotein [Labeo rohita]
MYMEIVFRESLIAFVECPTPDPVPSPPSPRSMEYKPEPTTDGESKPSSTVEPITSDQVREPVTSLAMEFSVEHEDAEESLDHCTSTDGELKLELGQMDLINFDEDIYADMPPLIPPSSELLVDPEPSVCPDLSACLDFPSILHSSLPQP